VITILAVNFMSDHSWNSLKFWRLFSGGDGAGLDDDLNDQNPNLHAPCHGLEVTPVWTRTLPKLQMQGSFRMVNVSGDDVLDVVFGYGTGAAGYNVPDIICEIYFPEDGAGDNRPPCMGGVMALDGKSGATLWRRPTRHEVFSLTCQADLDGDGRVDCVAGGRAGVRKNTSFLDLTI